MEVCSAFTLKVSTSLTVTYISAMVGLASIVVLLPAPGYLAAKMQSIQTAKMEKV